MGSLITLGIYAALALGAIAAVWGAIHSHDNGVRNAQLAKDTVVLEQVKKERDASMGREREREAETAVCAASLQKQTDAVSALERLSRDAMTASREAIASARAKAAVSKTEADRLRALAGAPPVADQSCADTLKKADEALRPVIKARQGAK